ncbi:MAG: hypothetical protein HYY25_07555 [Candidatus Wallbacteria bacterium]|nr:hypothetical protein [Candidatus Wallbacteria bacterium]
MTVERSRVEYIIVNLVIVFGFFWGFQTVRDRRRYRQIVARGAGIAEVPVEELVEAFYRSDERVAEIRRYVKISQEELLGDVKSSLGQNPDRSALLAHLREIARQRDNAQTLIAEGSIDLEEMRKMLFFASFLSAKECILGFVYDRRYDADHKRDLAAPQTPA